MKKVVVCGLSGSGKTTFAMTLSKITGIEVIHTDGAHYIDKSTYRTASEREDYLRSKLAQESWILDGCNADKLSYLSNEIDHIYYFELPDHIRLVNLIKRVWRNGGKVPDDLNNYVKKIYNLKFFYNMIFRSPRRQGKLKAEILEAPVSVHCVYINSVEKRKRALRVIQERFQTRLDACDDNRSVRIREMVGGG